VRAANRQHSAIHYTTLLPLVEAATGVNLSVETLRRYGREEAGLKDKRTKKRTAAEGTSSPIPSVRVLLFLSL
jgi:hypothetical protein